MARATDCVTTKRSGEKIEIHISGNWSPQEIDGIDTVASGIEIATTEDAVVNVGEIDEPNTAGASLVKTTDTPVLGGTRGISILREF